MKTTLTGGGVIALAGLAAVALGGLWLYSKRDSIASAAGAAVDAVNPASDKNLVYRGASAAVEAITGEKGATVGTWLYDLKERFLPSDADLAVRDLSKPVPIAAVDQSIMDRWDYYATAGRGAGAGSGSAGERTWDEYASEGLISYVAP